MKNRLIEVLKDTSNRADIIKAVLVLKKTGLIEALFQLTRTKKEEPLVEGNVSRLALLNAYQMGYQQCLDDITNPMALVTAKEFKTKEEKESTDER